ncbi:MAG: hypothetical protein Q7J60_19760 [Bradyrhizobium sp.]|uniref:hypothetical protein n=1 Tax=Bradyrhizobium sp. TaxID=376 RepID=UPI002715A308|nr:hypothetical protein [Bradyrhizobium sp.]MDO9563861.1 hypothetical protein [Bradyrhizobium sp.]MDP3693880.1 hypothetical protein [Bradyrhizobium sp.]
MSLYMLDAFIWILGTRGHIPQSGDLAPLPDRSLFGVGAVMRALAAFLVMVTILSLVLWLGVSLAIKLL